MRPLGYGGGCRGIARSIKALLVLVLGAQNISMKCDGRFGGLEDIMLG